MDLGGDEIDVVNGNDVGDGQASTGSRIFNLGISGTGFCKILGPEIFQDWISLKFLSRDLAKKPGVCFRKKEILTRRKKYYALMIVI